MLAECDGEIADDEGGGHRPILTRWEADHIVLHVGDGKSLRDGSDYLVVGSLGGAHRAPGWLHNVRARPEVGVQVGRNRFPAVATVIERGDDGYDRLWRLVNQNSGGRYDRYQARTTRPIPVVRLVRPS